MTQPMPRLVGSHEIRVRFDGISRQRAYQLSSRPDFPRPVARLAQGKVWLAEDVEAWWIQRRATGRRPKPAPE